VLTDSGLAGKAVIVTGGSRGIGRAIVEVLSAEGAGKIVNISSVAGEKGGRGQTNYAASKGRSTPSRAPWRSSWPRAGLR
jgi:NAD(P)-dependent dehydrogenase (short-subunit alcohol dehydrogenase family)